MSTATAHATRPLVFKPHKVELELVKALPEDLKVLDHYTEDRKPVYKLKDGMVYWLYSHANNVMGQTPYIIDEHTDPMDIKQYLDAEMVYIARNPFAN